MIDRACVSLSDACNLRCRYCHFQDKQVGYSRFSERQLSTIIENIHRYCANAQIQKFKFGIVGAGEPMLNYEEFLYIVDYVKSKKYTEINMYTITNGTLLTEKKLKKLFEYRDILKICFSLDGDEKIHNLGRQNFTKVMETIEIYKEIFGAPPCINATVNKQSYIDKENVIRFFLDNGLKEVTFSILVGCEDDMLVISEEEYKEFMEYVRESGISSRQFRTEKVYDCTMYGNLCGVGRTNVFITPVGIIPCGRFYKNKAYYLGGADIAFDRLEEVIDKFIPVSDGNCYYKEKVECEK